MSNSLANCVVSRTFMCLRKIDLLFRSSATSLTRNALSRTSVSSRVSTGPLSRFYCSSSNMFHARRALMYVPASDKRKINKAASLCVDTLAFDLEDGVAVNQKENARRSVGSAIAGCRSVGSKAELVVRINGFESGLVDDDLDAVYSGSHDSGGGLPDAIMLPKCDTPEHLAELDLALSVHHEGTTTPVPLIVIIESPVGLLNLREVCQFGTQSARHLRLSALVFGSDDFLATLGGTRTKDAYEVLYARQSLVTHAKAFGLDAIDLVDIDYKDLDSLRVQSEEGARMGYTGKQVIHPDQVPIVQAAFSPSSTQTKWATELIEAFHRHQETGKGAFVFDGRMIDKPLLLQAENIVRLQHAISNSNS
ncbi:citramalyl-CoA lyase, mitochondrial-like [Halichondria panicea]|uniref:citramalyl-CoA lyase, mitochondrial-like n=1 Tax=Halichondria panicea TaxID=6063 RepID=UPI00312B94D3